ncbi:MAG: hypothetical protein M3R10_01665, partial [Verrucomicrobiota bacterium]|nr:hypothetical protein [Verrucomicrobiota bacterium]
MIDTSSQCLFRLPGSQRSDQDIGLEFRPPVISSRGFSSLAHLVFAAGVPMKPLALVAEFNPPAFEEFHIIELLHALGETTTPPVPNYADLSATWAMVRYIWAFDRAPSGIAAPLRLSPTARTLDFHQKTLLSD